jgi:hypothetical protein
MQILEEKDTNPIMPKESISDIGGEEDRTPCPESCGASHNILLIYRKTLSWMALSTLATSVLRAGR